MPRLLFEKTGRAVWISHLDLMRVFQRAFKRAGLHLKHTQGFNPRPSVSIALPLSVGIQSYCELLDFDLDGEQVSCDEILDRLNNTLIEGVKVLSVYDNGKKIRDLAYLQCSISAEYNKLFPVGAQAKVRELFSRDALMVQKKTKSGLQDQDIIPMIRSIKVNKAGENALEIQAVICCQNPTLNPAQIPLGIGMYLPELKPDFCKISRLEIFDKEMNIFR